MYIMLFMHMTFQIRWVSTLASFGRSGVRSQLEAMHPGFTPVVRGFPKERWLYHFTRIDMSFARIKPHLPRIDESPCTHLADQGGAIPPTPPYLRTLAIPAMAFKSPSPIPLQSHASITDPLYPWCIGTVSRLWNRSDFEAVELKGAFGATTTAPRFIAIEAVFVHAFLPQFAELELQVNCLRSFIAIEAVSVHAFLLQFAELELQNWMWISNIEDGSGASRIIIGWNPNETVPKCGSINI
ncbi:hypothetical protein LXL04_007283 [Taraxacum kok-saghyz]